MYPRGAPGRPEGGAGFVYFRHERRLLGDLARSAWETVMEVYQAVAQSCGVPGMIGGIQTFGDLIHWHPHIHALVTEGVFERDGKWMSLPQIATEPFLKVWEQKVFALLVAEGKIAPEVVTQMASWHHSGFSMDQSVRLEAGDREGIVRLMQYILRCPFSQARMTKVTEEGKVVYKTSGANAVGIRWQRVKI